MDLVHHTIRSKGCTKPGHYSPGRYPDSSNANALLLPLVACLHLQAAATLIGSAVAGPEDGVSSLLQRA